MSKPQSPLSSPLAYQAFRDFRALFTSYLDDETIDPHVASVALGEALSAAVAIFVTYGASSAANVNVQLDCLTAMMKIRAAQIVGSEAFAEQQNKLRT